MEGGQSHPLSLALLSLLPFLCKANLEGRASEDEYGERGRERGRGG